MHIVKTVVALALASAVLSGCYGDGRPGHASDHHHGHHHDQDHHD